MAVCHAIVRQSVPFAPHCRGGEPHQFSLFRRKYLALRAARRDESPLAAASVVTLLASAVLGLRSRVNDVSERFAALDELES